MLGLNGIALSKNPIDTDRLHVSEERDSLSSGSTYTEDSSASPMSRRGLDHTVQRETSSRGSSYPKPAASRSKGRLGPKPLLPRSLKEALQLSELLCKSKLIPKGFENPEACLVGILYGMEVGLSPISALQRMAIIDGRPTIWGDAALALVEASGLLVSVEETLSKEASSTHEPDTKTAICTVYRLGRLNPLTRSFSVHDAIRAGLWQKPGPWTDYPDRMLMMRARAFALRDAFPDVLSGLYLREEFERGQGDRDNNRDRERERYKDTDTEWDKQTDTYKGGDLDGDLRSQPSAAQQQDEVEHSDQKPDRASVSKTNLSKYKRRAPPPPSMQDSKTSQSIEPAAAAPDLSPTGSLLAAEGVALQADITSSDMLLSSETDPDQSSTEIDFHGGLSSPDCHSLSPSETLQLFDDALCCAFDLETLEEIREDFQERLDHLKQEDTDKAARIFLNHEC